MTNSQKLLKKIILYAFGIGTISGVMLFISELYIKVYFLPGLFAIITGICATILTLTFIAFLITLIISSKNEN